MKILHFIACMMLPISIINNGYTMNNQMHNINNNENVLKNIEYVNSIFRILQNDSDNNLLSSTYFNMNNMPRSEDINIGKLHSDQNSNSNNVPSSEMNSERLMCANLYYPSVNNQKHFVNNQNNNNISDLNVSNFRIDINTKYENLMHEVIDLEKLVSSNANMNIDSQRIIDMINNIFDDINNNNKVINIVSLKQICDKYDNRNTIYNKIKHNNIFTEHKVIKLIDELLDNFNQYVSRTRQIYNIEKINEELHDKINKELNDKINNKEIAIIIDKIIASDNKYSGAKIKVVIDIDKDLVKKSQLAIESRRKLKKLTNIKKNISEILKLKHDITYNEFINNITHNEHEIKRNTTTLYEILNNDKYISDNIANIIYNNIIDKGLEHSYKICKCFENILKIKDELVQIWNDFQNNNNNKK